MGDNNSSSSGGKNGADLPSESDRKAAIGCLAAALNITFAAHKRVEDNNVDDNTEEDASIPDMATFSIRDEEDDIMVEGKSSTAQKLQQRRTQRLKSFQRELLSISTELLYLSPDNARVFLPNLDLQCNGQKMEQELLLGPFLQSLSCREESFRCISLLMFRFLLLSSKEKPKTNDKKKDGNQPDEATNSQLESMTIVGYDARVRFAFKQLTASILSYWEIKEHPDFMTTQTASVYATRKFDAIEEGIALRLSILSQQMMKDKDSKLTGQKKQSTTTQNAIRGLKIGAAGVAAGTVFAITGGLAAPAIIGGIAALAGASSAVTIVATVLLLPAATTIFGVGGGTLVATKMGKRTAGLNEFDIIKVTNDTDDGDDGKSNGKIIGNNNPELSRTICITGWLKDKNDFERPFTTPRNLTDPHELLCRYCSVYQPDIIPSGQFLQEWKGKEDELWEICKTSYGKDPRALLPLETGPRYDAMLTKSEMKVIDDLIRGVGLPLPMEYTEQYTPQKPQVLDNVPPTVNSLSDVLASSGTDKQKKDISDATLRSYKAWDFNAEYGSELYIVEWEYELLQELYNSAKDFQKDIAKKAAGEIAKKTALATLMAAVFVPSVLVSLSNIIDEKWTLATERADEAGILLAQSLISSNSGHRPVSLVGFSFGGRMIIGCLKELARCQEIWEDSRDDTETSTTKDKVASFRKSLSRSMSKRNVEFNREPASIIEDVIVMGTVASVTKSTWSSLRGVAAGRIVNCYSTKDMILALMYRSKNMTSAVINPPVGIRSVNVPGVENYDVSHIVAGHSEYNVAVQEILQLVGYNQPAKVAR